MERRTELLRAAARVYARHGYRGATTRRIADEARVNEVTIFRQFGTKDALIQEAIATCGGDPDIPELPMIPIDPERELTRWCASVIEQIRTMEMMFRRALSEQDEHPELARWTSMWPTQATSALRSYFTRLQEHDFADPSVDVNAAVTMYLAVIFGDAMGRVTAPEMYCTRINEAPNAYTTLLLRALQPAERSRLERVLHEHVPHEHVAHERSAHERSPEHAVLSP